MEELPGHMGKKGENDDLENKAKNAVFSFFLQKWQKCLQHGCQGDGGKNMHHHCRILFSVVEGQKKKGENDDLENKQKNAVFFLLQKWQKFLQHGYQSGLMGEGGSDRKHFFLSNIVYSIDVS